MDLSIVIPAFEENKKIARDIESAGTFLVGSDLAGEIIVVDDGSADKTSETAKKAVLPPQVHLQVIRYDRHQGKGYAVRTGVSRSKGKYVMFADSGCCVPYSNTLKGLEMLKAGDCDIAHGSRKLAESNIQRKQPWHRRVCSSLFKWFVHQSMGIPHELTDTQCGFKIYTGDIARKLYAQCVTTGFMFDVEIIIRALRQNLRIKEFPIDWVCDRDSRLSLTKTPLPVIRELIRLKRVLSKD